MRLQAAPRFLDDPRLVAAELVHDDLRNHKLDLLGCNQIFQCTDNRLFSIILCKIEPYACIYQ